MICTRYTSGPEHRNTTLGVSMKEKSKICVAFASLAASICLAAPSSAAASSARVGTLGAAAAVQCDLALAERAGSWTCPTTTRSSAQKAVRHAQQDLGSSGVSDADVSAVAAAAAYCTVAGCWDQIDSAHSTFTGTGSYGYGRTKLGDVELYYKITTSGSRITTYPFWFSSSRGTKNIILSAEYLYLSTQYPGGNSQNPRQYDQKSFASKAAGISSQWPSTGFVKNDTVAWVTLAGEATWSDPSSSYPGSWYTWAKSIKMQRQASGSYYVQADNALPSNPNGAGYRP
jgi:hypothetical protein